MGVNSCRYAAARKQVKARRAAAASGAEAGVVVLEVGGPVPKP
jgi:hypothetical protein